MCGGIATTFSYLGLMVIHFGKASAFRRNAYSLLSAPNAFLSYRKLCWVTNDLILLCLIPVILYFIADYFIYKMNSQYNDQKIHSHLLFDRASFYHSLSFNS